MWLTSRDARTHTGTVTPVLSSTGDFNPGTTNCYSIDDVGQSRWDDVDFKHTVTNSQDSSHPDLFSHNASSVCVSSVARLHMAVYSLAHEHWNINKPLKDGYTRTKIPHDSTRLHVKPCEIV